MRPAEAVADVRATEHARLRALVAADVQAAAWHTDLSEERDGRWQIVWSQATRIGASAPETLSPTPATS